jgi:hypothetical protein
MELYDEFHFEELCIISHFGATQRENAMKTQRLFAKEIMPRLQQASTREAAVA